MLHLIPRPAKGEPAAAAPGARPPAPPLSLFAIGRTPYVTKSRRRAAWAVALAHAPRLAWLARDVARRTRGVDPEDLAAVGRLAVFELAVGPRVDGDFWPAARTRARTAMARYVRENHDPRTLAFTTPTGRDATDDLAARTRCPSADDPALRAAAVEDLLTSLPPVQRQAVELMAVRGLSPAEAAARTGRPAVDVSWDCRAGMLELRYSRGAEPGKPTVGGGDGGDGRLFGCKERPGRTYTLAAAARLSGRRQRSILSAVSKRNTGRGAGRVGGYVWYRVDGAHRREGVQYA